MVAGINASQINGDAEAGYHKVGLNIGARGGAILGEKWEAALEILLSQQGSQARQVKGLSSSSCWGRCCL